mmetsp:Transcript_34383/g.85726  ORF Transcript_34383/g.85726 Transcript_34383/m.85726 type:complete len:218 (+) Transcript_34383:360-1013(+)
MADSPSCLFAMCCIAMSFAIASARRSLWFSRLSALPSSSSSALSIFCPRRATSRSARDCERRARSRPASRSADARCCCVSFSAAYSNWGGCCGVGLSACACSSALTSFHDLFDWLTMRSRLSAMTNNLLSKLADLAVAALRAGAAASCDWCVLISAWSASSRLRASSLSSLIIASEETRSSRRSACNTRSFASSSCTRESRMSRPLTNLTAVSLNSW